MRQWKVGERLLAKLLGCERVPVSGRNRTRPAADLLSDWLAVEVKTRRRLPVFLNAAMEQAERGADYAGRKDGYSRLPIVVLHQDRADWRGSLVVMRLKTADDYFGFCSSRPDEPPSGDVL